jgi:Tfp pilus assembly protein PilN
VKQVNAGVRFKSVENRGSTIVVEGTSVSSAALSDIISSIQSTGYFSKVEIKETYQENSKNQAFKFQLTCEVAGG